MARASIKRGDIYFITGIEATGSEQGGERPAVIVSNDTGNKYAPVVEAVYLTTKRKTDIPTHVYINSAERPSIALCEQIVTVCKSRLERYVGSVTVSEMRRIDRALSTSLGIHRAGGNAMEITMKTPFGELNFNMPEKQALDLIQNAFQYASRKEPEEIPQEAPSVAQEPPKAAQPMNKPQSRVERLFGDFRGKAEEKSEPEKPEEHEPEEYRGFLLIKCKHCGKIKGFCAKTPISEFTCGCGEKTELYSLKPAHLHCKCGSNWKYKTNITDEAFDYNCLNCGSPIDLELNSRRNTYVTITD